jgi:hypothetical protein
LLPGTPPRLALPSTEQLLRQRAENRSRDGNGSRTYGSAIGRENDGVRGQIFDGRSGSGVLSDRLEDVQAKYRLGPLEARQTPRGVCAEPDCFDKARRAGYPENLIELGEAYTRNNSQTTTLGYPKNIPRPFPPCKTCQMGDFIPNAPK